MNGALNRHPGGFFAHLDYKMSAISYYIRINVLLWPHSEIGENITFDKINPSMRK